MPSIIKAWSYSRLSCFRKCPRQFKYRHIDKVPYEDNYAASRGSRIHKLAESFVLGNIKGMPKELRPFGNELKELKRLQAEPEKDLTVTQGWEPTYTKDWEGAWCRAFADIFIDGELIDIVDHKTGRIYELDHEEQAKLYATCAMAHCPEAESVHVEMWYFDQDDLLYWDFERKEFENMKKYWQGEVKQMFREKRFDTDPGNHCRWCPFSKAKGGPCEY